VYTGWWFESTRAHQNVVIGTNAKRRPAPGGLGAFGVFGGRFRAVVGRHGASWGRVGKTVDGVVQDAQAANGSASAVAVINPIYAVSINPDLVGRHESIVTKERWIPGQ
jgi:hypothetical protein